MNGPFSMAMLNNQRVGGDIIVAMIVLKHLFLTARANLANSSTVACPMSHVSSADFKDAVVTEIIS